MEELTSSDRVQRVRALFDAALEQDPQARDAFLEDTCGDDLALLAEIESLVRAYDKAPDVLQALDDLGIGLVVEDDPYQLLGTSLWGDPEGKKLDRGLVPDLEGKTIGAYRLLKLLGRGGMGAVYLAERIDGQFHQRVALKLILQHQASEEGMRRFRQERQILARLQHPNIAFLLDGGLTEQGLPYLVMEYVKGEAIDVYCKSRRLGVHARLKLVLTICEALQFAHQNLVVHRDLKPSNVLVTDRGEVKLLDFGIAKLMDEHEAEVTLPQTTPGRQIMTVAYAAPEQVAGDPVSTATDVHALGVLLYRLLTNRHPFPVANRSIFEIGHDIRFSVPEKPSVTSAEGQIRKQLAGDLDAIIMQALRKEPERRYGTVAELAEDIRRHLHSLPVRAQHDTLRYRVSKFVNRHRATAMAGALATLTLITGLAATTWQASIANENARKADQTLGFFLEMFEGIDPTQMPWPDGLIAAKDLIYPGLNRIATLDEQPDIQANVQKSLGQLSSSLGLFPIADSLLNQALATQVRLYGEQHLEVAQTRLRLGKIYTQQRRYEEAQSHLEYALRIITWEFNLEDPQWIPYLIALADIYLRTSAPDQSKALLRQVLDRRTDRRWSTHPNFPEALAMLGEVQAHSDSVDQGVQHYQEALEMSLQQRGERDPRTGDILFGLANWVDYLGRLAEAEKLYRRALDIDLHIYGEGDYRAAMSYYTLGRNLYRQENYAAALTMYQKSIASYDRSMLDSLHAWRARSYQGLGKVYLRQKRPASAERPLRSALLIYMKNYGPDVYVTIDAQSNLGECLSQLGRYREAEVLLLDSLDRIRNPGVHKNMGAYRAYVDRAHKTILQSLVQLYERRVQKNLKEIYQTQLDNLKPL